MIMVIQFIIIVLISILPSNSLCMLEKFKKLIRPSQEQVSKQPPKEERTELLAKAHFLAGEREKLIKILQHSKQPKTLPEFAARINTLLFAYKHYDLTANELRQLYSTKEYTNQITQLDVLEQNIIINAVDVLMPVFEKVQKMLHNRSIQVLRWQEKQTNIAYEYYQYIDPTVEDSETRLFGLPGFQQSRFEKISQELYTIQYILQQHFLLRDSLEELNKTTKFVSKGIAKVDSLNAKINEIINPQAGVVTTLKSRFAEYKQKILNSIDVTTAMKIKKSSLEKVFSFIEEQFKEIIKIINSFYLYEIITKE